MTHIPDYFPWDPWPTAMPGAQPKFSARLIGGRFVVGLTASEREERYRMCTDLLDQLKDHLRDFQAMRPEKLSASYLGQLEQAVRSKRTDISSIEITWMFRQLKEWLS